MATRLRVDYPQVENIKGQMLAIEKKVEASYDVMDTAVSSLVNNGYMDGDAAQAYVDEFRNMLSPDLQALEELITTYAKQLGEVCDIIRDADKQLASMIF